MCAPRALQVDTELVYAYAKTANMTALEEFIAGTHQANLQVGGSAGGSRRVQGCTMSGPSVLSRGPRRGSLHPRGPTADGRAQPQLCTAWPDLRFVPWVRVRQFFEAV